MSTLRAWRGCIIREYHEQRFAGVQAQRYKHAVALVRNWEFQAYGNNLTDRVMLANTQRNYASLVNMIQFQSPRTYGVRLRYEF